MSPQLKIQTLHGQDITPYVPILAELRICVFREYPYLYEGNLTQEKKYLQTYINAQQATVILVSDDDKVVGASTSVPLAFETDNVKKPFLDGGMRVEDIYYLGESVLLPTYRGQGIYQHFFSGREQAARAAGCHIAAFCAVNRDINDPRKPANYLPLDPVWKHFGYEKHPQLQAVYDWQEIGDTQETSKTMTFWLKNL